MGRLSWADLSAILSNFVSLCSSVPEYGKCVLRKSVIMCRPSLHRHYWFLWYYARIRLPVARLISSVLLLYVILEKNNISRDHRLSPVDWMAIVKHDWPSDPARATAHSRYRMP